MSLITKYITKARVTFDPFSSAAASSRSFLARMPPSAKVDLKVLPQGSTTTPLIEVTFKDKHVMKADPAQMPYNDVADLLNSHSRRLLIDDAVKEN
ncbi:large ribosomal subunit protein mL53 [Diutina catenulata]